MQMMKTGLVAMIVVGATLGTSACGRSEPAGQSPASTQAAAAPVAITFKTDPDPAKTGENAFEVTVTQGGKPVNDATVSAEFFMAAMPAMKMPEMRMKSDLPGAGNGAYRGKGQVPMAGDWEVTVMAMRNGQELASKKVTVTAK